MDEDARGSGVVQVEAGIEESRRRRPYPLARASPAGTAPVATLVMEQCEGEDDRGGGAGWLGRPGGLTPRAEGVPFFIFLSYRFSISFYIILVL